MLLHDTAMRLGHVFQRPLRTVAVWCLIGDRLLRVVDRLAVDGVALDLAGRAEVGAAETAGEAARRRAVARANSPSPKPISMPVLSSASVGIALPLNSRSLMRTPEMAVTLLRRTKHRRQSMQGVDRHVVERTAARLAEVPRGVDVGRASRPVGVLPRRGGRCRMRPRRPPRPGSPISPSAIALLYRLHLRPQHFSRGGDDPQILLLGQFDQLGRFGSGRGHRLVEVDVLAGFERRLALFVSADPIGEAIVTAVTSPFSSRSSNVVVA